MLAVIALAAGICTTFFTSRGFVKTTAIIVDIEQNDDPGNEFDSFTPHRGVYRRRQNLYRGLNQSSGSYKAGNTIPVLYDPNDPGVVHGGGR